MSTNASDIAETDQLVGRRAEEAVPMLMARLGDRVFKFGLKFCGNREDAEDLVQETFLRAFRNWDQFEGRSSPTSWLYTILAHGCQRMNRRRAGQPATIASLDEDLPSGFALAAKLPSRDEGPESENLRKEAVEVVDRGLSHLPVEYRLPLVLKEIAELPLREIGQILGIKEATVKTRVHRGRLALRAELVRQLGTPGEKSGDHPDQICLDLLRTKMDAMDRGIELPIPEHELCDRCRSFLDSLDLTSEACQWVHGGDLPDSVRKKLEAQLG